MTTTAKVKVSKPFLPVRKPKAGAAEKPGRPVAAKPAAVTTKGGSVLVIGGEPRVHLLPKEVIERKKSKAVNRRLGFGVVGVVVIVGLGLAAATLEMTSAQSSLDSAQAQSVALLSQRAKYGAVTKIKADAAAIQASQKLATAQEIAWQPYFLSIQNTLPAGASITSITAGIDSPFAAPSTATVPLEGPRIATVKATLSMQQATISSWLDSLANLKGFVDANPDSVNIAADGSYVVSVTIHVNSDALANRFTKAGTN